jgi:hypothetical protein
LCDLGAGSGQLQVFDRLAVGPSPRYPLDADWGDDFAGRLLAIRASRRVTIELRRRRAPSGHADVILHVVAILGVASIHRRRGLVDAPATVRDDAPPATIPQHRLLLLDRA